MQRALKAFVIAPSRKTYLAAFQAFSRSSRAVIASDIALLTSLARAGDRAAFSMALTELPALAALSPAVHALAAMSAHEAGDPSDAELEESLLSTCLTAILESGDGSAESPFLVVCTADERLVCQALDLEPGPQALVNNSGRALDVVQCLDGTDLWFDVSRHVPLPGPQALRRKNAKCAMHPRRRLTQTPR